MSAVTLPVIEIKYKQKRKSFSRLNELIDKYVGFLSWIIRDYKCFFLKAPIIYKEVTGSKQLYVKMEV